MNRRNSEGDQLQYNYDQNPANYIPIDSCANYRNSQRVFKKISACNTRRIAYKNPEAVLNNYQTYFVPVTDYNSTGTAKVKQQSIRTHYSYSSNSTPPTYVQQDQDKGNDGVNNVIYLKYPDDDLQLKDSKYYSQSNYMLKEQENFLEYDVLPTQNYSYYVSSGDKSIYENSTTQIPKMVYSSYVPEIDVKFANNPNFYYPHSSEPSISSQRSFYDLMDFPVNKSNHNEVPEKMSNKAQAQELSKNFPDKMKRMTRSAVSSKMNKNAVYQEDSIYGTPCDETPTKQHCTINANTQTSNHALTNEKSVHKLFVATKLNNEFTQTDYEIVRNSRSKETQTLSYLGRNSFFGGFINNLAKKGYFIYTFYLRTTVIRWLRRILIELAWSVYNCPSNCPMQDRIIFSYLNHIERKSPIESNECENSSSKRPQSRRSCRIQRINN